MRVRVRVRARVTVRVRVRVRANPNPNLVLRDGAVLVEQQLRHEALALELGL